MKRRIAAVTGIRSEYDILYSTLRAIDEHPELELLLVVTGTHLSDLHGGTVREIEADGLPIAERVVSLLGSDTLEGRAKSAGVQLTGLAEAFARLSPDLVVTPCDREEAITTAVAATYLNLPLAHMYGGDRTDSGIVDEQIRHATTKLAHLHLTMTDEHRDRVLRLGEEPWRVHVVGHGGLDRLLDTPRMERAELASRLGVPLREGRTAVVLQHSITNDVASTGTHMRVTLEAVDEAGMDAVVIHPNSDVGSQDGVREIRRFVDEKPGWVSVANLPRTQFVNLLRHADVLVGNSTCGIQEAPTLGLPAVNVGPRQTGRLHADNVIFVPHERDAIAAAVRTAVADAAFRSRVAERRSPFGDGRTGPKVAEILAGAELGPRLTNKGITY